jgi:ABC-type Zn uptake system ZnuABC Zn-binding protein ZnuA
MRWGSLLFVLSLVATGCGPDGSAGDGDGGLRAVATTTHAADFVRVVGGDRVEVRGLLSPTSDPHDYEPRPSDARAVSEAELVVRSGGELDEWLRDVVANAGGDAEVLTLIDHVERLGDDPHWWQDPRNVVVAADAIGEALAQADPDGGLEYRAKARAYGARVRRLDAEIARCMAGVPARQRKLVTTHDALGYFALRYDVEVIGAVIPALSSQAQPSAGDTDRLVRQIRSEDVETIFPESALNPELEEAIAREAGAEVGEPLWADALGPEGSSGATYLEAMAANADALVRGFSGGERGCRPQS